MDGFGISNGIILCSCRPSRCLSCRSRLFTRPVCVLRVREGRRAAFIPTPLNGYQGETSFSIPHILSSYTTSVRFMLSFLLFFLVFIFFIFVLSSSKSSSSWRLWLYGFGLHLAPGRSLKHLRLHLFSCFFFSASAFSLSQLLYSFHLDLPWWTKPHVLYERYFLSYYISIQFGCTCYCYLDSLSIFHTCTFHSSFISPLSLFVYPCFTLCSVPFFRKLSIRFLLCISRLGAGSGGVEVWMVRNEVEQKGNMSWTTISSTRRERCLACSWFPVF